MRLPRHDREQHAAECHKNGFRGRQPIDSIHKVEQIQRPRDCHGTNQVTEPAEFDDVFSNLDGSTPPRQTTARSEAARCTLRRNPADSRLRSSKKPTSATAAPPT